MHLLITCVSLILWILRPLPLTRLRVGVRTNWRKKGVGPVLSIILSQHLPLPPFLSIGQYLVLCT